MTPNVTAEISTRDRYNTTLPLALSSIICQTVTPQCLHLYDDGEHRDLRQDSTYSILFKMMESKGIQWKVFFGARKGQVFNHQRCLETAETDLIWRVDDDDLAEPNALEKLLRHFHDPKVGAVSGPILTPGRDRWHTGLGSSRIEDIYSLPNSQWYRQTGIQEVDHFNNSFLYRRAAASHGYCSDLSPVGHREETIFSHEIKRGGYRLVMDPEAVIWHLRDPQGGIRSHADESYYRHDEAVFSRKMQEWGVTPSQFKLVVMDNGMGDHMAFSRVLPQLLDQHPDEKIMLALCYPELFQEYISHPRVRIISIADAHDIGAKLDDHNIYKWMGDRNWSQPLWKAFAAMHEVADIPLSPHVEHRSPFLQQKHVTRGVVI